MKTILKAVFFCALVAGCSSSGARLGEPKDLGTFRLSHNVVIADNATKGPFSRDASAEELAGSLKSEIDRRLGRYEGDKLFHLGVAIDGYILALPGIPLVASPRSALIISVRVWDDALGQKLTENPKQITVLESFSGGTLVGSGLTRTREQQLANLTENAALAIESYLAENPQWFQTDAPVEGDAPLAEAAAVSPPPVPVPASP